MSAAVDEVISEVAGKMKDRELACLFSNTALNTLDTTVASFNDRHSYIITGDISAMWLRDSMNQVSPYFKHFFHLAIQVLLLSPVAYSQSPWPSANHGLATGKHFENPRQDFEIITNWR